MYKGKKILGVITARGGSKGIPRKNIKLLGGKPLIAYSIEAARQSKLLTDFIVSTEDEEIAEISRKWGAPVPFMRPQKLARDDTGSIEVIIHALNTMRENYGKIYDYVMILQPTSPFRLARDIDNSIKKIVDTKADSVMSMVEVIDFSPKKLKILDGDIIKPWLMEEGPLSERRQNETKVYKRNCAIYLTKVEIIKKGDLFGKISRAYVMPPERSIDINEPLDFEWAEFLISKK